MITACDLEPIHLFGALAPASRTELARKAADLHIAAGDYVAHEGENPYFFILLQGSVTALKHSVGRIRAIDTVVSGAFFGEVPIMLGGKEIVSLRADVDCRLARLEISHFHQLVRDYPQCHELIEASFLFRTTMNFRAYEETSATRVSLIGYERNEVRNDICRFLNLSRITYEQLDHCDNAADQLPFTQAPAVVVDGFALPGSAASVREVATALGMRTEPSRKQYDVLVIGGGPTGLAASVYGASEGLSVLTVEAFAAGGQAGSSARIENYLGFPEGISGNDLANRALRQAERLGAEIVVTRRVTGIRRLGNGYCCELDDGEMFRANAIILATGIEWRCLRAEGINRLQGRGVLYGAARTESTSILGKNVFIVGGGNSAGQAALYLADYANSVTLLIRGAGLGQSMSSYLIAQISQRSNIAVEPFTEVVAVQGKEALESIKTVKTNPHTGDTISRGRRADALFVLIGARANTDWLPAELLRDENGFVCTGQEVAASSLWKESRPPFPLETSLPGVFCAGDLRHDSVKRVSASVGEGSIAISFVHQYFALQQKAAG